jgi:serine/threonine protein phosphatase PrpC
MRQANQVIYHCNSDYDTHMSSTLTVALLYKHRLYVGNVGDSRAYHYNTSQGLYQITTDHTLAANLVAANLLQPEEVYTSPKRDKHYRSLGQNYQLPIDLFQHEVEAGDLIILCTDGLWHMVRDEHIEEIVAQGGDPQKLAQTLIDAAKDAGGDGNASVIVVNVE